MMGGRGPILGPRTASLNFFVATAKKAQKEGKGGKMPGRNGGQLKLEWKFGTK
jgi:hypothetical protein